MNGAPNPWSGQTPPRGRGRWGLVFILAIAALVGFLIWRYPDALAGDGGRMRLIYFVALLALVSSGVFAGRRLGLKRSVKYALAWVAVAVLLVLGYSFRFEIESIGGRMLGELLPYRGTAVGESAVRFRVSADGHFRIEALVDGTPVRFLVDTGASDVVLSPADARRLGFDVARLAYTRFYNTANGVVRGAPVRLGELAIGPIRATGVLATVNEAAMENSLLGMSFLERLSAYEVRQDTLTLHR